jgi:hypothetical protein
MNRACDKGVTSKHNFWLKVVERQRPPGAEAARLKQVEAG